MKKIYFIINLFVLATIIGCASDDLDVNLDGIAAPSNVSALTTVTQDNTGKVTFLPKGEGVTQFKINFGDGSPESDYIQSGGTVTHVYKEGVYKSKITAMSVNGKTTEVEQDVVVSFRAPENLEVVVTNDLSVSKKVTVTATADFALFYDVYFGEAGKPDPISANNGASVSYTYQQPGVYTIRVVAKSAAVATTEYTQEFEAILILGPTSAAPIPTNAPGNVISLFSDSYTNVQMATWRTSWSEGAQDDITVAGNAVKKYSNLNFAGAEPTATIDASAMTYLHVDVWSLDFTEFRIKLVDFGPNGVYEQGGDNVEHEVKFPNLAKSGWVSLDIPLSDFTGLTTRGHIAQIIFSGNPSGSHTVYIDNFYFYKEPAEQVAFPFDFESSTLTYGWGGFGGVNASIATNPNKTGINVSDKVVKMDKTNGAQVWGGASLNLEKNPDFAQGTKVKLKVWSPKVGADILYKMELSTSPKDGNGNPTVFIEVHKLTTVANAWEELTFDLTSAAGFSTSIKYDRVILFPDFNVAGAGETYYFDDIKQSN
jgi:hypothetical protein